MGGSVPSIPLGGSVPLGPIASVGQVPTSGMSSGPVGGVAIGNLTPAGSGAVRGVGGAFPNREMEGVLPMMSQVGVCWGFSNVQLVIELLCHWWGDRCHHARNSLVCAACYWNLVLTIQLVDTRHVLPYMVLSLSVTL